ncbi:unnamed protein product [Protopolystoma xenopodis]|uniref:Uncharacterized protein n=1 Tax=Protopolystoma xenopodis TaxID=117903 RepID=A0A3S4ZDA5_9PLAT|nr:unnamed protein product [Protopolystoma xenopodis]
MQRDPRCELVHELSGQLAVERGQFDAALQHFDAAIRQSKTLTDLAHLMSLRDGVIAQMTACQRYGISIHDMLQSLQQDEKQAMILAAAAAAAAAGGGGGIGV